MIVVYLGPQLSRLILYGIRCQRIRDDFLTRSYPKIFLIKVICQVHVGVPLIRQKPEATLLFHNDG